MSYCFPNRGSQVLRDAVILSLFPHAGITQPRWGSRRAPHHPARSHHRLSPSHRRAAAVGIPSKGRYRCGSTGGSNGREGEERKKGQIEKLTLRSPIPSPTRGPQRGYPCPGVAGRGPGAPRVGRCSGQAREVPGRQRDRGRAKPGLRSAGSCLPAGRAALRQLPAGEDSEKGKEIKGREPRTTPPREAREGRASAARPGDGAG